MTMPSSVRQFANQRPQRGWAVPNLAVLAHLTPPRFSKCVYNHMFAHIEKDVEDYFVLKKTNRANALDLDLCDTLLWPRRHSFASGVPDVTTDIRLPATDPLLIPRREVMRLLSISPNQYRALCRSGAIETVKIGVYGHATWASVKKLATPQPKAAA